MTNEQRIALEQRIVRRYIKTAKAAGWRVDSMSIDSEDASYPADLFAGDDATLIFERDSDQKRAFVTFVYGNAPDEVLCDCSVSIDEALQPVTEWAEGFVYR